LNYHDPKVLYKFLNSQVASPTIINCSGFTGRPNVDECEIKRETCWNLNVASPLQMTNICNKLGFRYLHVSSGCIYNGYDKDYTEEDEPNFGMFNESSYYSKTKHEFEILTRNSNLKIVRLRMPIDNDLNNPRNYLAKIIKYPNLINYKNSKTSILDLCSFIKKLIEHPTLRWVGQDIYNAVNPKALTTERIIELINEYTDLNITPNWIYLKDLDVKAPRSNCILDGTKANQIHEFMDEEQMIKLNLIFSKI
jgi:dTDP-4-dehydrorhamnose reductase